MLRCAICLHVSLLAAIDRRARRRHQHPPDTLILQPLMGTRALSAKQPCLEWMPAANDSQARPAPQARTESAPAATDRALANARNERGELLLAKQPAATDGTCQAAPAVQTSAAAVAFAARVAATQRANSDAPGGCYLDC